MILLNTGPSARGWHRLESFLRCPQLYAWGYGRGEAAKKHFPPTFPLVRGSIGHVGLAHVYARVKWVQDEQTKGNAQPNLAECPYYSPIEAMRLVAGLPEFEEYGTEALPGVVKAVSAYVRHYSSDGTNLRVIAIEEPVETEFFGHRYTARVDLVLEDNGGKVWYLDHKFVAKVEGKVFRRYVLSGQFLGLQHLGMRTYGERFGGVKVNVIGCNVSGFSRVSLDPAPYMLERFPSVVKRAEEGIARVEAALALGEPIGAAPSEHVCFGPYGECPAFYLCQWGEVDFRAES